MRLHSFLVPIFIASLLIGGIGPLWAEDAAAPPTGDVWSLTRETATGWWEQSRDYAGQALEDARRLLSDDRDFGRVWDAAIPKLEGALTLEERQSELPESAWFGADQASNRAEIDKLLDQAVDILSVSPALRHRDRIQAVQTEIEKARAEIAEYRQKRVSAPSESTIGKTVADYDRLIEIREDDIERLSREADSVKREFAQELRAMGLELGDEQVEFLLSTVVGDNLVDLGILFDNVKSITQQLERLVAESGEDLQSARRYYGLYVVLLRALQRMHLQIEEAIGEQYLPQIDGIVAQAQALSGETRRLLHVSPDKQALLTSNLEAQQLTIEAAGVYRQYLDEQARQVRKARQELDRDIDAAWNTYETVRVSGELVGLVKSSQQLLESLMNRQIPTLRPFENLEMQREFQKLTQQLRGEEGR
ncbi:hypothetical protein CCR95_03065 [Thiocystis minor]|uniref:hypothetical protein n=1 Tax=Thiocystis minor TaxID=61597 RepID=UPI00191312F1|nr:hypothetical protein [Thiocystis minor]MBK5963096.1 hypothetical protein [Thiocystis minor]